MATVRSTAEFIPSGMAAPLGTVRGGSEDIPAGMAPEPSPTGTQKATGGVIGAGVAPGQLRGTLDLPEGAPLDINGETFHFDALISLGTGEAEVYRLQRGGRPCVLKLYYPGFTPKTEILEQLAGIDHPDIINIQSHGYAFGGRFYEIMDYAEGGTLDRYLPIRDLDRIKGIVGEVVNALRYCHERGIVHRDIKPENLYLRHTNGTDILIGDFGISSLLDAGVSRRLTSQGLTVGYAAPEMYGIGGKTYIGQEVDYYALGVTVLHIWEGKNPFKDLQFHEIANLTISGNIHIPDTLPRDFQNLVKGLLTINYTQRWGADEIERWLRGENVPVYFQRMLTHPAYQFGPGETAAEPADLSELLRRYREKGVKHLYGKKISLWLAGFNQGLAVELDQIVEKDFPRSQDAGLQKAIYLLDPDLPYGHVSGGQVVPCRTAAELADALEDGFANYLDQLASREHPFYLYLEARGEEQAAATYRKYYGTFGKRKALNSIILHLREHKAVRVGGTLCTSPTELLARMPGDALAKALEDPETPVSLWLEAPAFAAAKARLDAWRKLRALELDPSLVFAVPAPAAAAQDAKRVASLMAQTATGALGGNSTAQDLIRRVRAEGQFTAAASLLGDTSLATLDQAWAAEHAWYGDARTKLATWGATPASREEGRLLSDLLLSLVLPAPHLEDLRRQARMEADAEARACSWYGSLGSADTASPALALVLIDYAPDARTQACEERKQRNWPGQRRWLVASTASVGVVFGLVMAAFRSIYQPDWRLLAIANQWRENPPSAVWGRAGLLVGMVLLLIGVAKISHAVAKQVDRW